ncbi:GLPGLI family protein [Chryseobacterium sp. Ch-15]|uniref:GLPGLI family protein n=1 Tax=Chryseobacterium muglaense TaxID=2893752 RepID=A0A9Q3USM9_9FLAO|nr:GLPGLI family protein [Chryseobacterium muglaense]MBD3903879.1 GLPGLI family protein [Chryseobacterium muglaense]MCC9032936.1 GLPGLI family protein [Chryseobacterium muglaense]MCM2553527.1 GLPGLI family protein [Chryseobacterium muglaense]
MKKIIIGICSFLTIISYAQNQRFSYEYKFITDSTNVSEVSSEIMYLDVAQKGSKFYSQKKSIADSIHQDRIKKQTRDFTGIDYGLVPFVVEKSYPDFKVNFFNNLDMNKYKVSDTREMNWKILSEKEKIGDFNTQKASLYFAGRIWTAWFVSDIPIQDGPYKFHGLPGLIIKIEDKTKSHSFVLKEIKKLTSDQEWVSDGEKKTFGNIVIIDQDKYKKQVIDFRNNPTKGMRQMLSGNTKIAMIDENGKPLDIEKMLRDKERDSKVNNARNNNFLELDLLK